MPLLNPNELKFPCPNCGGHLLCDMSLCGIKMTCPHCQNEISVPRFPSEKHLEPANVLLKKLLPEIIECKMYEDDAIIELRETLKQSGCHPLNFDIEPGDPLDVMNFDYLRLIIRMNRNFYFGYHRWKTDQDTDSLYYSPAQELLLSDTSIHSHNDTLSRWTAAGGKLYGIPSKIFMIALKNDPIWVKISAFGIPYPPFDYNSGLDVRSVDRRAAIDLGLLKKNNSGPKPIEAPNPPFIAIGDLNISASLLAESTMI